MGDLREYSPNFPYMKHLQAINYSFVTITKPLSNNKKTILSRIKLNVLFEHCKKYHNFIYFLGVEILWKDKVSA